MRISIKNPKLFSSLFKNVTNCDLDYPITGLSTDSREIIKNDLFISIKGNYHDGNTFLNIAKERQASAVLVSKLDKKIDIQQILVSNPVKTISEIAKLWRKQYSIPVLAITGSNGKTSTKELLIHTFSDIYNVHATKANHNTILGLSLTLLELDKSHEISILELGASKLGEIKNLCNISNPTHGLITNIAPAHLIGFGSIEKISKEKGYLFNSLKNGLSFVNLDDKRITSLKIIGKSISFGSSPNSDFSANINIENDGKLTLVVNSMIIPTKSYNLSFLKNCIAVAAIGITLGISESELKSKIQSFKTPNGRCSIKKVQGITIIDDSYNANLNSSLAALDYLNAFLGRGKKIFIFGDMFELGEKSIEQHSLIGQKCNDLSIDVVLTIGKHTEHTNLALNKNIKSKHYHSPGKVIAHLKKDIKPDDILLFKGSRGMRMENIIKGVFDI
tara:strand:+ start:1051 stop:2391 length:1341 start_codon:yes stop_codon:yes gene_type:complete